MRSLLFFIGVSLLIYACGGTSPSTAPQGSGSHGGDPIRFLFKDAQKHISQKVGRLKRENEHYDGYSDVQEWLFFGDHQQKLAKDLRIARHDWTEDKAQGTCARVDLNSVRSISLSIPLCRDSIFARVTHAERLLEAERLLVHESVHRLGKGSCYFADRVALFLTEIPD